MSAFKHILLGLLLILLSACAEKREPLEVPSTSTTTDLPFTDTPRLEEIITTASTAPMMSSGAALASAKLAPDTPREYRPRKDIEIQAGTITAADYDDNLNSQLYSNYASRFLQKNKTIELPFLDLKQGIAIAVKGLDGNPVAGLSVKLMLNGKLFKTLKTPSSGLVRLYPGYDKLPASFEVEIAGHNAVPLAKETLSLVDLARHSSHTINLKTSFKPNTQLDLALVIDTTGSMGDELAYLKKELRAIINNIQDANSNLDIKVGLVVYRDTSDAYVTRRFDFTDPQQLIVTLGQQDYDGGGDYPEAMDQALISANALSWRAQSTKVMLLVADAPPHDENSQTTWNQANKARSQQIHIVPIGASGVGDKAQYLMRTMAALTQSRYIFLTDDSGVGNAHAEPSVDCYAVTRLDNLITRVVNGLIVGKRIEAQERDIIRRKGNYQNGVCFDIEKADTEPAQK